jgi:hypothetical protein
LVPEENRAVIETALRGYTQAFRNWNERHNTVLPWVKKKGKSVTMEQREVYHTLWWGIPVFIYSKKDKVIDV